jgi:hypothetical protein
VALDLKFLSEGAAKNGRNFKSATPDARNDIDATNPARPFLLCDLVGRRSGSGRQGNPCVAEWCLNEPLAADPEATLISGSAVSVRLRHLFFD